jgi:hypothetical protein
VSSTFVSNTDIGTIVGAAGEQNAKIGIARGAVAIGDGAAVARTT